jgi:hypothetical protein
MYYSPASVYIGQRIDCTSEFDITDVSGTAICYICGSIKTSSGRLNHLAYVYENTDLRIYVNGTLSSSGYGRATSAFCWKFYD